MMKSFNKDKIKEENKTLTLDFLKNAKIFEEKLSMKRTLLSLDKERKQMKECTFRPNNVYFRMKGVRSFSEFIKDQNSYQKMKENHQLLLEEKIFKKEALNFNQFHFAPKKLFQLNQNSSNMNQTMPIFEKLFKSKVNKINETFKLLEEKSVKEKAEIQNNALMLQTYNQASRRNMNNYIKNQNISNYNLKSKNNQINQNQQIKIVKGSLISNSSKENENKFFIQKFQKIFTKIFEKTGLHSKEISFEQLLNLILSFDINHLFISTNQILKEIKKIWIYLRGEKNGKISKENLYSLLMQIVNSNYNGIFEKRMKRLIKWKIML